MHTRSFVTRFGDAHAFTTRSRLFAMRALAAAAVMAASTGASAQTLTYQHPSSYTMYVVEGGPFPASAFTYAVPSGSSYWTAQNTVQWRYVDAGTTANVTAGSYADATGQARHSYRFHLQDQYSSPWWGGPPRVELDSANPTVQASSTPDPSGWTAGVITPGMEQWFLWSMYLDPTFPLDQQWCTLFQLKHGHTNYVSGEWPKMMCNGDRIAFGFGPDTYAPGQLWSEDLAFLRREGKWVDFALHAKWSTGADGVLEFSVNGISDPRWRKTGNNFYTSSNGQPFYYVKQGYYRANTVPVPGTVYMTPVLVMTAAPACEGLICSGICVDKWFDPQNCGACGRTCPRSRPMCDYGNCVNPWL